MVGLSSARCGRCRCECGGTTTTTTHGDVVRNRNNKDDPDAVLEGLAMAGLVAILRQLGDLAELAAEVFDDLQDQVMAASARGRRLAVRAKRLLEADLDHHHNSAAAAAAAAALTITTSTSTSTSTRRFQFHAQVSTTTTPSGEWSPPRLVVQLQRIIRRCRGPPRLSLLDKFDAAGEGACLKRYTDPSFFFRAHSSSAKLQQGTPSVRPNRTTYLLKSMSMETSCRPKSLNSEPPESGHTITDCKSETDASEAPSPGFLNMLRHLKQQRQATGPECLFRMQQTAVDRVQSWPQLDMEKQLQGSSGTAQPSPSPSELERTSSFEAWLPPDARRLTTPTPTPTPTTHRGEHEEITQEPPDDGTTGCSSGSVSHVVTTSNADADADADSDADADADAALTLSSSTMLKAKKVKGASDRSRSRCKAGSVEMIAIASRVSSLPRKLFMNIKHHNDCARSDRAAGTGSSSQATAGIGDCSPQFEAVPRATEAFLPVLLHSNPVHSSIHSLLPENDEKCYSYSYLQHHESKSCNVVSVDAEERHHQQEEEDHPSSPDECSNNNSSTPETCGDPDPACAPPADSKNLLLPGILILKRAAALAPENSSSEETKVDTTPPLPPIPPVQWLSEKVLTASSPKHRALWKKSLEVDRADRDGSNDALHSVRTQLVSETILARSQATSVPNENANANASRRDETKCSEYEETSHHPQPFREDAVQASQGNVLKAGEFPMPAILSGEAWSEIDLRKQAQVDTCFQQEGRLKSGSGHSDHGSTEKPSQKDEASDSSSNLQNESVFFSAVQELAKMSPPPSVPRPKYSLLHAVSHGRITLRNGPSLTHPSRNILDSRTVLIEQIKDIAVAGNPSFQLKPVCGASSPVTGSPTNSKVATILQRADDIRQAHANNNNEVDSEESWSDDVNE